MNRIELYVDKNDRLTLDFYYKQNADYPMAQFKGEKCYSVISQLCETPLLRIKDTKIIEDIYLVFSECVLNINEYEKVFRKRGTGPIKKVVQTYYNNVNVNDVKPKKVKRTNKYAGKRIIASTLVFALLGAVGIKELLKKDGKEKMPVNDPNSYTQETEVTESTDFFIIENDDVEDVTIIPETTYPETLPTEMEKEELNNEINISINYEDRSDTEKATITKAYYGKTIEEFAKMYGLDPNIVIAIATQERGVHAKEMDSGGATGLMQIQNSVWIGEKLSAYNYQTGEYDTVTVYKEDLSDVFYNIKYGCMIFQNCMDYMNNNVLAAIQCYNMGYGNMMEILNSYSLETGKTVEQILLDVSDCGWLEHRNIITVGDDRYIENVLSWVGSNISVQSIKSDIKININNNVEKNMSIN